MPSILALVTDAFGGRGGIAQYNRDFLAAFASAESEVVVLPRHAPDAERPPNGIDHRPQDVEWHLTRILASDFACLEPDTGNETYAYASSLAFPAQCASVPIPGLPSRETIESHRSAVLVL
jgi:hypothetical protein